MRADVKTAVVVLGASFAMITTVSFAQEPRRGASFEITPYIWAAGIDTEVTVNGQTAEISRDFSDIVEGVDVGGDLLGVAKFGRFVLYTQLDFLSLNTDELDNRPAGGTLDVDFQSTTVAMGVELGKPGGKTYELLFGARELSLEPELTLNGIGTVRNEHELTDPLIMFRLTTPLGRRWKLNSTFSYGEGDSEKTYEMWPQFQLQISDNWAARFGYRRLFYDIQNLATANRWDGSLQGLTVGIGGTFGGKPKPVAAAATPPPPPPRPAAAPPPPPPPPAPPPDTDRDGVADARDQCADTRSGERVDAIGCSYEMRLDVLFAHDSADLSPESNADLDQVVELLMRVTAISGVVEGHSDSSGAAEYNQSLSERRARAVMAYLTARGISASRLQAVGFGESRPVADNNTDAGRAENRRVVLRRSDSPR